MITPLLRLGGLLFYREELHSLEEDIGRLYKEYTNASAGRPPILAQALLVIGEDHRYFSHRGVDYFAICRALWRNMRTQRREGASTIEMQMVRVVTRRYENKIARKIREACLATLIYRQVPKTALPGLYLSVAYYGYQMNGFRRACQRLSFDESSLTVAQGASLIARLKYPERRPQPQWRIEQLESRKRHLIERYINVSARTYKLLGASDGLQPF